MNYSAAERLISHGNRKNEGIFYRGAINLTLVQQQVEEMSMHKRGDIESKKYD